MKKIFLGLLLVALSLAAAPWPAGFEKRALTYLNFRYRPRPVAYDGQSEPTADGNIIRSYKCWGVKEGLVCSACYDNSAHYYAQAEVLCPWNRTLCRWLIGNDDLSHFKVDNSLCDKQ